MAGPYYPAAQGMTNPATAARKVTKSDTVDLPDGLARALWVGVAGTANLTDEDGNLLANFPLLEGLNPLRVSRVRLGGTADDIWALY